MNHDSVILRKDGEVKICLPTRTGWISHGLPPDEARDFASKVFSAALAIESGAKDSSPVTVLVVNAADRQTPIDKLTVTDPQATGDDPAVAPRIASLYLTPGSAYLARLPP